MDERQDTLQDTWREWSKYVLKELERLNGELDRANKKLIDIEKDIVMLQVKSGLWGAAAGAIPVAIMLLLEKH